MNDYDLQEALVKSKLQRYQQQAQTPAPQGQMIGKTFVAPNVLEYLAAGLRGYGGMKGAAQTEADMTGLAQRKQAAMADALRKFGESAQGTPAQPGFEVPANEMDGQQTQMNPVAAKAPDMMGGYQQLIASGFPELQKLGMQGALEMPKLQAQEKENAANRDWRTAEAVAARDARAAEAQATRDARAADLQARLADARTSQQERLAAQKELRQMQIDAQKEMKQLAASMAAGMRQPEAPVAVIGPDGKPVYVNRKDAIGRSPATAEKGKGGPMSVTLQKELLESDDTVQSAKNVVGMLEAAKKINKDAYSGYFAKGRAVLASNLPGATPGADATINIDNMMTGQALENLKATFGGMPTEGERKILLEMQASVDKTPKQREDIMDRAIAAAKRRSEYAGSKAKSIRSGEYLTEGIPSKEVSFGDLK
jgi:hypothetical protein